MCKRGLELILSLHASCAYATLVFLRNDLNWITICEEALIGDVGYDSSQGPAPAIGTNRRELMLYQVVLI